MEIPADHKKIALTLLSDTDLDEIICNGLPEARRREVQWEAGRRRHQRGEGPDPGPFPGEPSPPPRAALELDGRFVWGIDLDGEFSISSTYETRAEAVNAGRRAGQSQFQTARLSARRMLPPNPYSGTGAIDDSAERASDECWESSLENFQAQANPHAEELDRLLDLLWDMWCAKHGLEISGYTAEDIERHDRDVP